MHGTPLSLATSRPGANQAAAFFRRSALSFRSGGVASETSEATASSSVIGVCACEPSLRMLTVRSSASRMPQTMITGTFGHRMLTNLVVDLLVAEVGLDLQPGIAQKSSATSRP